MSLSETQFKNKVMSDLEKLEDIWILKTQERTVSGIPDIIFCLGGYFGAIELKVDGKRPSPLQDYRLTQIQKCGGYAFYTTPSSWDTHYKLIIERFAKT